MPFIALFLVLSLTSAPFLTKANLLNIVDQQASTLIPAAAATLVLVAGGIDLSIGAVYGLAGVVAAQLALSTNPGLAILVGLLVGLGIGLVNGVLTTVLRINALIATLATAYVVSGISSSGHRRQHNYGFHPPGVLRPGPDELYKCKNLDVGNPRSYRGPRLSPGPHNARTLYVRGGRKC